MSGLLLSALCLGVCVAASAGSPDLLPFRCAPCTPQTLLECPPVAPGCAEVRRMPGCGCCSACALREGEACGFSTAHCGSGLRCTPRPDESRPLHALMRGHGVCAEPDPHTPDQGDPELEAPNSAESSVHGDAPYLPTHAKPFDPRVAADAQERMKAKVNAIHKKLREQGPCHLELQRAMEKISRSQQTLGEQVTRFYLPNCDKHGFYKAKQCESSLDGQRGRCWCVSSWDGKRILGSAEVPENTECQQELTH